MVECKKKCKSFVKFLKFLFGRKHKTHRYLPKVFLNNFHFQRSRLKNFISTSSSINSTTEKSCTTAFIEWSYFKNFIHRLKSWNHLVHLFILHKKIKISTLWGGTGGRETGRKGGGRCTGGGRRGGGKRDSQGSGKREKKGKITQHCAIFRNRINAKGREAKNTGREPGLKGTGSGRFKPPCSPPPPPIH